MNASPWRVPTGSRTASRSEASPYLLQHAHNPVDWFPWGEEALAEAKRRDVPILLSIGYSACHWCHVMERESFEDDAIAKLMNEHFVCIKVDREERPDLDQIYQLVVQLMGRSGGWPLTVFLTPAQKPFFAGTYFPPADRYGMPGFPKILARHRRGLPRDVATRSTSRPASSRRRSPRWAAAMRTARRAYAPQPDLLERRRPRCSCAASTTRTAASARAEPPKFPNTMPLEVLLRRGVLENDGAARDAARSRSSRCARAASGITSAAASIATRPTSAGSCRTSRRCSTTTRCSCASYVDGHRVFAASATCRSKSTARDIAAYVDARDDRRERRLLREPGRGQRGRGGEVLRVESGRRPRGARRRRARDRGGAPRTSASPTKGTSRSTGA